MKTKKEMRLRAASRNATAIRGNEHLFDTRNDIVGLMAYLKVHSFELSFPTADPETVAAYADELLASAQRALGEWLDGDAYEIERTYWRKLH